MATTTIHQLFHRSGDESHMSDSVRKWLKWIIGSHVDDTTCDKSELDHKIYTMKVVLMMMIQVSNPAIQVAHFKTEFKAVMEPSLQHVDIFTNERLPFTEFPHIAERWAHFRQLFYRRCLYFQLLRYLYFFDLNWIHFRQTYCVEHFWISHWISSNECVIQFQERFDPNEIVTMLSDLVRTIQHMNAEIAKAMDNTWHIDTLTVRVMGAHNAFTHVEVEGLPTWPIQVHLHTFQPGWGAKRFVPSFVVVNPQDVWSLLEFAMRPYLFQFFQIDVPKETFPELVYLEVPLKGLLSAIVCTHTPERDPLTLLQPYNPSFTTCYHKESVDHSIEDSFHYLQLAIHHSVLYRQLGKPYEHTPSWRFYLMDPRRMLGWISMPLMDTLPDHPPDQMMVPNDPFQELVRHTYSTDIPYPPFFDGRRQNRTPSCNEKELLMDPLSDDDEVVVTLPDDRSRFGCKRKWVEEPTQNESSIEQQPVITPPTEPDLEELMSNYDRTPQKVAVRGKKKLPVRRGKQPAADVEIPSTSILYTEDEVFPTVHQTLVAINMWLVPFTDWVHIWDQMSDEARQSRPFWFYPLIVGSMVYYRLRKEGYAIHTLVDFTWLCRQEEEEEKPAHTYVHVDASSEGWKMAPRPTDTPYEIVLVGKSPLEMNYKHAPTLTKGWLELQPTEGSNVLRYNNEFLTHVVTYWLFAEDRLVQKVLLNFRLTNKPAESSGFHVSQNSKSLQLFPKLLAHNKKDVHTDLFWKWVSTRFAWVVDVFDESLPFVRHRRYDGAEMGQVLLAHTKDVFVVYLPDECFRSETKLHSNWIELFVQTETKDPWYDATTLALVSVYGSLRALRSDPEIDPEEETFEVAIKNFLRRQLFRQPNEFRELDAIMEMIVKHFVCMNRPFVDKMSHVYLQSIDVSLITECSTYEMLLNWL